MIIPAIAQELTKQLPNAKIATSQRTIYIWIDTPKETTRYELTLNNNLLTLLNPHYPHQSITSADITNPNSIPTIIAAIK